MIVSLTRYTTRLALRIRTTTDGAYLTDWRKLQLVISPNRHCKCNGSPWFLSGCWPFHPTGVDVANSVPPDFPAIVIDAFEQDAEGRIVFPLDQRVHSLPNGRYHGTVRAHEHTLPINIAAILYGREQKDLQRGASVQYRTDGQQTPCDENPPLKEPQPAPCCNLVSFDIDLGPECAQHMIDQCAVEFAYNDCGVDE